MKKFITLAVLVGAVVSVLGADVLRVPSAQYPVINSASTTNTAVNFPAWPVVADGTVTDWTPVSIADYKEIAIQFTTASTNTTTTSNAVWYVYRSVQGTRPTSAAGTNVNAELLGTVTNVLNGTAAVTSVAVYTAAPKTTAVGNQSTDLGIAGVSTLYIGKVVGVTGSGLTNYQVFVGGK